MVNNWVPKYKTGDYIMTTSKQIFKIIGICTQTTLVYDVEELNSTSDLKARRLEWYYIESPNNKYLGDNEQVVRLLHQYK